MAPMLPLRPDVVNVVPLGLGIQGIFLPVIIQSLQLFLPDQRVVVNVDLASMARAFPSLVMTRGLISAREQS